MASTDARPVPRRAVAYRVTFPIQNSTAPGLVTGAAALDSEISKDGGTFVDCTNEATEIATTSGMYFLDLTATEMTADTVAIIVKTSTSGAFTTPIVLYPEDIGDYRADVQQWLGTAVATPGTAGVPSVDIVRIATAVVNNTIAQIGTNVCTTSTDAITNSSISAAAVDEILDDVVEGTTTLRQAIRLFLSALVGKVSGAAGTTVSMRDLADTKNRIVATVDANGNRTAVTLDVT